MIKMDYGDAVHKNKLEFAFCALLDDEDRRQKEWKKLRKKLYGLNANFKRLLPPKLKKMMIMPFTELATIYEQYVLLGLDKNDNLHLKLKELFSYEKIKDTPFCELRSEIIKFFIDERNNFNIHSCHYCDMSYINYFQYAKGKRTQFDLDHVLDKGRCPIVALSLYNLVPVCPTCNGPHIKGQRTMDVTLDQRQKLSPTSTLYDFDNKVKFWIRPIAGKTHNTNMLKRQDEYELDFDISADMDYKEEIDFFFLKERYNYHKCEALRLVDLKSKYSKSKIVELARIICGKGNTKNKTLTLEAYRIVEQIRADIFGSNFSQNYHRAFGKLHKDIIGI